MQLALNPWTTPPYIYCEVVRVIAHRPPPCPPHDKHQSALAFHLAPWAKESRILSTPWETSELEVPELSSEDRFAASSRATLVSGTVGMQYQRPMALIRTASTGGPAAT